MMKRSRGANSLLNLRPNLVPAKSEAPNTHQKALEVNLDPSNYGVFAEIGAGQEVARWFFRVGGAAGANPQKVPACRANRSRGGLWDSGSFRSPERRLN